MPNDLGESNAHVDVQNDDAARLPRSDIPVLDNAKVGWPSPAMLSLEQVQELCKTLVMLEAKTAS